MGMVGDKRPVILMVDSDQKRLAEMSRTLSDSYEFVTYSDGQDALDWLAQNHDRADVIIADLVDTDSRRGFVL